MTLLAAADISFLTKAKMIESIRPAADGDVFQLRLVAEQANGTGIAIDATGVVENINKDRTACVIRVRLPKSRELRIPVPHEPGSRSPGIVSLEFAKSSAGLPTILNAAMHVDTFDANTVADGARADTNQVWAAKFTADSGIQMVSNAPALTHHVGRALSPAMLKTHDNIRSLLRGIADEQIKGPHVLLVLQNLLDEWTLQRIRHAGGTTEVFAKEMEGGEVYFDRSVVFEAACAKKFKK